MTLADPGIRDLLLPVGVPLTEVPRRVARPTPMCQVVAGEDETVPLEADP